MGYICAQILFENNVSISFVFLQKYQLQNNFALKIIVFLSFISILIAFSNIYTLRDYFALGLTEARNVRASEGIVGRPLGILSSALIGIPVVAMVVVLLRREMIKERWIIISTVLLFIGSMLVSISFGGRNGLFISLLFVLCTFLVRKRKKLKAIPKLPFRIKHIGVFILLMALIFSATVFVDRESLRNRQPGDTIQHQVETFDVSGWAIDSPDPGVLTQLYVMINIYFTHSLNEFDYLISNESDVGPFFGAANFYQLVFVLNKIGFNLYTLDDVKNGLYRPGVYIGFLGMLYLDFGVIGAFLIMYLYGFISKMLWMKIRRNNSIMKEIILVYLLVQIFAFPFYSIVPISNGFAILIGIIIFYFVSKFERVMIFLGETQPAQRQSNRLN